MAEVEVTSEFRTWYENLTVEEQAPIYERVALLERVGSDLKRPFVGEIQGSAYAMKELIIAAGRASFRILFVFDPRRSAVLLLGGDKSGEWNRWYRQAVPKADRLYEDYLAELRNEGLI